MKTPGGYAAATLEGTDCVLGLASIWMEDVTVPDTLYDESRFLQDPTYAYFMSNFNLLTYLIQHRDNRVGQFLVSKDDKRRQVFSIDNGISFGFWPYNFFIEQWENIYVPALRKDSIERLRKIQRQDLDFLGVIVQLELDDKGVLRTETGGGKPGPQSGCQVHRWHSAIRSVKIGDRCSLGPYPEYNCRSGRRQHPGFLGEGLRE